MSRSTQTKRRYIGEDKPEIERIDFEEPLSYTTEHQAKNAEGDYLAIDDQPLDDIKE
jgi:hypothetical protein